MTAAAVPSYYYKVGENMGTEESKKIWEENAQFWDNAMGQAKPEYS